jgi:hypothetical protein
LRELGGGIDGVGVIPNAAMLIAKPAWRTITTDEAGIGGLAKLGLLKPE